MYCLIKPLLWLLGARPSPAKPPPVDYDLTYVTTAAPAWPFVEVERPWWCGAMEVHGSLYTADGVTEVKAYLNPATRCKDCGEPITERKVLAKMDVDPARAEWRHTDCDAHLSGTLT